MSDKTNKEPAIKFQIQEAKYEPPKFKVGITSWNSIGGSNKIEKKETNNAVDKNNDITTFFNKLSDRFVDQQDQITDHRGIITKWFAIITAMQLLVINVLVFFAIFNSNTNVILDFMKYFVGATFLELLGGLFIIVKFVFGHETSDMLKHLTYNKPSSKDKQDKS